MMLSEKNVDKTTAARYNENESYGSRQEIKILFTVMEHDRERKKQMRRSRLFLILLAAILLLVGCTAPQGPSKPFREMEITEVAFTYGAEGGVSIPVGEAAQQEIVSLLKELTIDPTKGSEQSFYGETWRLDLTVAEGESVSVHLAEHGSELYMSMDRGEDGSHVWYPVTEESGSALYDYCKALA